MLNQVEAIWRPEGMEEQAYPIVEPWSARSFKSHTSLSLVTKFGNFDICPRPDGTEGYDDLIRNAVEVKVGGDGVKVVHLDDSIRIKRAIGGTRYLSHLPSSAKCRNSDASRAWTESLEERASSFEVRRQRPARTGRPIRRCRPQLRYGGPCLPTESRIPVTRRRHPRLSRSDRSA